MILYYDARLKCIDFGMNKVKNALKKGYVSKALNIFDLDLETPAIVVRFSHSISDFDPQCETPKDMGAECYQIEKKNKVIFINAYDKIGAMYGLFDIAETIENKGISFVEDKICKPFLEKRGIKHNLPYQPYDMGDPFSKNSETMMDKAYWKAYIEMLASNRYNTLSLWSENPFTMMFRLDKYPNATKFSDREIERFKDCYHFIFSYCRELGISTYLVTWNVRITEAVATGLGLPSEIGDMEDRYDLIRDERIGKLNSIAETDQSRCHLDVIKDYFKECIKTLCLTYTNLTGLGTTSSEEMSGTAEDRVHWVKEAYLEGIKESGRTMPFIFRTNCTATDPIVDDFMKDYKFGRKFLSWKYSNAHMYSSTQPQFEKEWSAWDNVDLDGLDIMYTVRNDDFHTFRGGSFPFLRDYIKGMKVNPKVVGFYWGADGYVWGKDFQHVSFKHKEDWEYDWERHWYEFSLMGRLGYDPTLDEEIFICENERHYTKKLGKYYFDGFNSAMGIIQPLQRTSWINYDFEAHPEAMLTVTGFRTVLDYIDKLAMPGVSTASIKDTVLNPKNPLYRENTYDCLSLMKKAVDEVALSIENIENNLTKEMCGGEIECALLDLKCWFHLGTYYLRKIEAALDLAFVKYKGDESYRAKAIELLSANVETFERLSLLWSSHYLPYKMVRSKMIFGYSFYVDDVKKDIELAKNVKFD